MDTVLIIEDDGAYRGMMTLALQQNGYRTLEAGDGASGLQVARSMKPDLVVTDIVMEKMDGYGVLTAIRNDPVLATTPVIMVTGWSSKGGMREGMALGADDYISKPFRAKELMDSVKAQLAKRRDLLGKAEDRMEKIRTSISSTLPHELRTPLTAILGFSEILAAQARELDREVITDMSRQINGAARRLIRVADNVTMYSDIELLALDEEACKKAKQVRTARAADVVRRSALEIAKKSNRAQDLVVIAEEGTAHISVDYLGKIITEVVDNAFKFSPAGSEVSVKVEFRYHEMRTVVSDKGVGMTPEEIAALEPFVQFERDRQEQSGLGIGLVLAGRIAGVHGGSVGIHSEKDVGTKVEIRIPAE